VKIEGVLARFQSIPGVVEDATESSSTEADPFKLAVTLQGDHLRSDQPA